MQSPRAVVTVLGQDQIGIIARVATALAANQVNILDITQTTLRDLFAMIMLVDLTRCPRSVPELRQELEPVAREMGLQIQVQVEDLFRQMHRLAAPGEVLG